MNHWFRMYNEVHSDPKVQTLPPVLFKAWINLLCLASMNDGILPPVADVAFRLRFSIAKASYLIEQLIGAALLSRRDDGEIEPHNWEGRQFKSDSSGERVTKYRDKRKSLGLPVLSDYTKFKAALIERDSDRCVYCEGSGGSLVVDHITPIALNGTDHIDNLALACKSCNSGKAGRTPELAGMTIRVSSARDAYNRYRDTSRYVTVTVTPPDSDTDTDSEQTQTQTQTQTQKQKQSQSRGEPPATEKRAGIPDPAADQFSAAYRQNIGNPYGWLSGDFVQLAKLRKRLGIGTKDAPPNWEAALLNYFGTPLSKFSLQHLATDFDTFVNSPLDRFGKPTNHAGGKRESALEQTSRALDELNRRVVEKAERRIQ